jgi:hypothetical protein
MRRSILCAILVAGLFACTADRTMTEPTVGSAMPAAPGASSTDVQTTGTRFTLLLPAVADGSVRDGNTVVDNSVVQTLHVPGFEDRGIIEFDMRSIPGPVFRAMLSLRVFASNGPYPFTIDVYGYRANGKLGVDDWDRGTLVMSFQYSGEPAVLLNVTTKVQAMRSTGAKFAGFNFRFVKPSQIPLNGPFVAFHSMEYRPAGVLRIRTKDTTATLP